MTLQALCAVFKRNDHVPVHLLLTVHLRSQVALSTTRRIIQLPGCPAIRLGKGYLATPIEFVSWVAKNQRAVRAATVNGKGINGRRSS